MKLGMPQDLKLGTRRDDHHLKAKTREEESCTSEMMGERRCIFQIDLINEIAQAGD